MNENFSLKINVKSYPGDSKDMEELINSIKKDFGEMNFYSQNNYKLTYLAVIK